MTIRNYTFQGACVGCGGDTPRIENASAAYLKEMVEKRPARLYCMCGAVMRLRDDGVGTQQGGGIKITNESPPTISSITPTSAGQASGASVRVFGSNFSVATPTVIFGDRPSPNVSVLGDTQLDAILPEGSLLMRLTNLSAPLQVGDVLRGQLSSAEALILQTLPLRVRTTGTFQAGEPIKADAGPTATFASLDGAVDVTVESVHGRHKANSTLPGGFSYT